VLEIIFFLLAFLFNQILQKNNCPQEKSLTNFFYLWFEINFTLTKRKKLDFLLFYFDLIIKYIKKIHVFGVNAFNTIEEKISAFST
jgi:hypothetical protein